jgi:hypothetical protein
VELTAKLAVVAFFAWALWTISRPRYAFVVQVGDGLPEAVRGKVTPAFLARIREVCDQHGVRRGTVRGVVRGRRISLDFSSDIPLPGRQQLRNWWAVSGWSARPSRA